MGRRMIVVAPDPGAVNVTLEQFRAAAGWWRSPTRLQGEVTSGGVSDATLVVEPPGESRFHVIHFRDERMISTDGIEEQAAEVAVWAADNFPMTGDGALWLVDQGYTGHVVLRPGMTVQQVLDGWKPHDDVEEA